LAECVPITEPSHYWPIPLSLTTRPARDFPGIPVRAPGRLRPHHQSRVSLHESLIRMYFRGAKGDHRCSRRDRARRVPRLQSRLSLRESLIQTYFRGAKGDHRVAACIEPVPRASPHARSENVWSAPSAAPISGVGYSIWIRNRTIPPRSQPDSVGSSLLRPRRPLPSRPVQLVDLTRAGGVK
jgi:hypothetical protein